ncbi:DUF4136 domain-containing protein [Burkholderia glumae]|uniref:DUF4136 domain-containing protein n=1 Tax=Burkholderia glumae TaxID=337 RepID=UPI000F5E8C31|nr:DUF4136 domain-containing protein [Burkholderia glumae]MCM2493571.1 DUF4136 domain-containing protein [Burkholderia glumae]MCM2543806.1 DUF4136 domain-containing protein [Burkholderia glumae]MCQ0033778.1 DUF4136 domain-containing protein [Burkholderia glumae]MCQ0039494.1 DUF4136 domain-containing protein [Burkholderia glumae]QJW77417.1 DUF4136 domain-containing protein [Burkholderia glumae]
MKTRWARAAGGLAVLGMLGACAAPTTGVSVQAGQGSFAGERSYGFARPDAQQGQSGDARVQALVRAELARHGYREQPEGARYRVVIAYATQRAELTVTAPERGAAGAGQLRADGSAPFPLPFAGPVYRHLLTLQFIDRRDGSLAYQVTSAARDRDPDPLAALPALVRGALAKLPFDGGGWAVTIKRGAAGAVPTVESIEPARSR